jgi:hypothetical protein
MCLVKICRHKYKRLIQHQRDAEVKGILRIWDLILPEVYSCTGSSERGFGWYSRKPLRLVSGDRHETKFLGSSVDYTVLEWVGRERNKNIHLAHKYGTHDSKDDS